MSEGQRGVLVTGGAGYIGSHIVRELAAAGTPVQVIDDLSSGYREALGGVPLVEADFADAASLDRLLGDGSIDTIVHMAALCHVGDSIEDPASYYETNVTKSLALLEAARRHGIRGLVFSSSAAVYGEPREQPVTEDHPQEPTNPYGETKLVIERALAWYRRAYGLRYVALRYFNAAGAHPDGDIGEDHPNEARLIPRLLHALQHDKEPIPLFGEDYETPDGTCVRDYVHVVDLARAHVLALDKLRRGDLAGASINLGTGSGFSVRQVVDTIERVVGQRPPTRFAPRREGDPATLVASHARAAAKLGWTARQSALEQIVASSWAWHRRRPQGFGGAAGSGDGSR